MTRKQLIKKIASLIPMRRFKIKISTGFSIIIQAEWVSWTHATIISPNFDFPENPQILRNSKAIDWSKLIAYDDEIIAACKESDRQAKEIKMNKHEYFEDLLLEAEEII